MIIAKANPKENLGELVCLSITKAKAKTNPQNFICNRFRADGIAAAKIPLWKAPKTDRTWLGHPRATSGPETAFGHNSSHGLGPVSERKLVVAVVVVVVEVVVVVVEVVVVVVVICGISFSASGMRLCCNRGKIAETAYRGAKLKALCWHLLRWLLIGNGPNTVSGSTVSNTELSEFFGAH